MSNNYEQPVEPMSRVEDILRGDTANVPQSRVEDLLKQLIEQGGGGGSTVIVTPILEQGTKIASISVNGSLVDIYAPTDTGSEVSISTIQKTGTKIATLTIDDTNYDIYAPEGGSSGGCNLYGTTDPTNDLGSNGDIYMKYTPEGAPAPGEQVTIQGSYCNAVTTQWTAVPNFDTSLYYSIILASTIGGWTAPEMTIADISSDSSNPTWMGDSINDLFGYVDNNTLYLKTNTWGCTTNNITAKLKLLDYAHINAAYCKLDGEWLKFPGYSEKVLYDTPVTPTVQSPATIELNDSYKNYDALIFYITNATDNYYATPMIMTRDIAINHRYLQDGYGNTAFAMSATFLSDTSLTVERPTSSGKAVTYEKIYGIKYGNGGGGGSSSHNYSTDEQVVGTWIDGSDIYEVTLDLGNSVSFQSGWNNVIAHQGAYALVFGGTLVDADGIGFSVDMACNDSTYLEMYMTHNGSGRYLTFRYTKTTD